MSDEPRPGGEPGDAGRQGRAPAIGRILAQLLLSVHQRIAGAIRRLAAGPGATAGRDIQAAFAHLFQNRHLGRIGLAALAALYLLSGVYVVNPGEEAVVRRFGRVVRPRVGEGLHYRLPWPAERADKVNVSEIRREGIGVSPPEHGLQLHPPEEVQVLTGDENIVNLKVIVQYRVKDLADFLFRVDYDANPLIRNAIKHALTAVGAAARVDSLLTVGRTELQRLVQAAGQRTLDEYRSGVQLVNLTLQEVIPPKEAADAFRDVAGAREDRAKAINDAEGYRNSILPEARGKAERMLREAEGYRADAVNRARGDAARFASVLAEYRRSAGDNGAEVTLYRYYVEAMEKILPRVRKYVVDPKGRNERVNIRVVEPR
ncbi:MAG TPA: FtsH protease activity modulator HflK [Candidatus Rokubacteria bacterium]|nr:FtsH protease activity modulator HflK [Candidatus Rokubacteria bacterium]